MHLAVDIGNTKTKVAWFNNQELSGSKVFDAFSEEELWRFVDAEQYSKIIVSTVKKLSVNFLERCAKSEILLFSQSTPLPILVHYATPATLGLDRLAAAVGAQARFPKQNVLVFDFGSCITTEFVSAQGVYCGGAIAPGLNLRFKAMHTFTDKLPLIPAGSPTLPTLTGDSTESCMQSGVVNGILFEISGSMAAYDAEYKDLKVIFTGGDASYFESLLNMNIFAYPYLVLRGLNVILEYNAR